ncbi:MAG: 1-deoxy-D-xylulose-5-phosphate synthase [Opitutales bacterium]|nr:1-deoxy-D-xylulose-5-phosphate synthase [Opitutales bacterium]
MGNNTEILKEITGPADLKKLDHEQIEILCQEIRNRIIDATSQNGGHVGPNLGVVELTVALHIAFDTPQDSFFWDVSHQGYVHKLLTGRNDERFEKIRQSNGLSGFLSREESKHDAFGAGHAGTALSAALGRCIARDLNKKDEHVVAVAGDAAFTCGITLEALNNIASSTKRFILILNDNEWSIAKNVGAFSKYFNELITNPAYTRLHKDAESFLTQVPGGPSLMKFLSKAKRDTKELIAPSSIFEKLGIRYLGPIDGHDVQSLVRFFEFAKTSDEPIVLHLLTQKGKGFPVALEEPEKWHGSGPFDKQTGQSKPSSTTSPPKYQDVFGECLSKLAAENENIVGITAAMPSGTGLDALHKVIPERFFDVGIAEEHAVLLAAGMATGGKLPVCAIYSTFLQRAYDPIIHDVCLQNLPVTFCLDRAGLSPNDGPTHHGLFDISYLRCVPNGIIMQPKDEDELQDMMATGITSGSPSFIRYPRGEGVGVQRKHIPVPLEIGKAEIIREGSTCSIWAIGDFVQSALHIADHLLEKYGIKISVVNARFIKPIDEECLLKHAESHEYIVTLEDNVLMGGFGSSILEVFEKNNTTIAVKRFGWPDQFIEHGNSVDELRSKVGLDQESLTKSIESFLLIEDQLAAPIFA